MPHSESEPIIIRKHIWPTRMHQKVMEDSEKLFLLTCPQADVKTALSALLQRPWFIRLWMVQEVAVAKKVHLLFGRFCLGWQELKDFVFINKYERLGYSGLELISHSDEVQTIVHARALVNFEVMSKIFSSV